MKNHCFSRKHVFHTWKSISYLCGLVVYLGHIFHTLCCLSYLVHLFHTLVSLVFFHTFDIISYLLSVVSYLQWVYFHTFWDAISYQNYSISYLLLVFFHTLGITISYLLQSVSHPEQIYSYPNWTIHNPGWKFTIKLSYGSIGRHEWHTHPPTNRNLVP